MRDVAQLVVETLFPVLLYVHAVHKHLSLARVVKPREQVDYRAFAAARGTDKSHCLTALGFETYVVKHVFLRVGIPETDVFKLHHALFVLLALRALALDNFGLGVDDLDDTLCRYVGSRHDHQKHAQHEKAHEHLHGILRKHRHCRIVQISRVYQRSAQPINGEHKSAHDQIHAGEHYAHHFVDKHIDARKFFVCVAEFLGLIILGVVGAHHSQAGEIFTRYAVQTVDFFLHDGKLGACHEKNSHNNQQQRHYSHARSQRQLQTAVDDTHDRRNCHDRRDNAEFQHHHHCLLYLHDVVCGTGNQTRGAELFHFLHAERIYVFENFRAEGASKLAGDVACNQIAEQLANKAARHNQQHKSARTQNFAQRLLVKSVVLNEAYYVAHKVGQHEVEIDLQRHNDYQKRRKQPIRLFEILE